MTVFDFVYDAGQDLDGKLVGLRSDGETWVLAGGTVIDSAGGRRTASEVVRGDRAGPTAVLGAV